MNSISASAKHLLHSSVRFLNRPPIKEGIKNVAGSLTFLFGLVEVYDIYQILRGRAITTETHQSKWVQQAYKVLMVFTKISLLFSGAVSRPGVFLISSLVERVLPADWLQRIFGPNTRFVLNPRHPRHLISFIALAPPIALFLFDAAYWVYKKVEGLPTNPQPSNVQLTDSRVKGMALFNTISSRPVLHLVNRLLR